MKIKGVEFSSVSGALPFALLLCLATVGSAGMSTRADTKEQMPPPRELSLAEKLLFGRRHLQMIQTPSVLNYSFRRKVSSGEAFKDRILVKIDRIKDDGRGDISFEFFTGKRRRPYPAVEGFRNNPIIMLFLTYDIWEQARVIGGKPNYFRNRIRDGFRKKAKIDKVAIQRPGGPIMAEKITIEPYVGDRNREKFKDYELKKYEIVLSPDVPGGVVEISAIVPAPDADKGNAPPLIEARMIFESIGPLEGTAK